MATGPTSASPWGPASVHHTTAYRAPVLSANGVVATPHYLATLAGAQILRDGGSAVDAAIGANLVLGVVWPHMCGLGGDLMAQVWSAHDRHLYGLNSSGRAGAAMTSSTYRERGLARVPHGGPLAITVPGAADGWYALHARWGRLEPDRLFSEAIREATRSICAPRTAKAMW
jgi:gamma-glutamyltranspeptidase/glutathione hydrolase